MLSLLVNSLSPRQPLVLSLILLVALFSGAQAQDPTPAPTLALTVDYSSPTGHYYTGHLSNVQISALGNNSVRLSWRDAFPDRHSVYFRYHLDFINLTSGSDEIIRRTTQNREYRIDCLAPRHGLPGHFS